jgi:hypothetical protein
MKVFAPTVVFRSCAFFENRHHDDPLAISGADLSLLASLTKSLDLFRLLVASIFWCDDFRWFVEWFETFARPARIGSLVARTTYHYPTRSLASQARFAHDIPIHLLTRGKFPVRYALNKGPEWIYFPDKDVCCWSAHLTMMADA